MTTCHVYIAVSLDGFIAREDGNIDWLMKQDVQGEDHGYDVFMASVDGLIMGRGSFEKIMSFDEWPYKKPVVVMSGSMTTNDVPEHLCGKVRLSDKSPDELLIELNAKGWKRAYVDGGQIIQSFLKAGLIADMTLTHIPVLIGSGRRLFGALNKDLDLTLVDSQSFPSGLVDSRYKVSN